MSDFNQYEAADTLIMIRNNANQNIDNIYNKISEERKKKENFEYQYKSISENYSVWSKEIIRIKKEIQEIKNNNISLPFHGWAALSKINNNIINNNIINKNNIINNNRKSHSYNLRPRN